MKFIFTSDEVKGIVTNYVLTNLTNGHGEVLRTFKVADVEDEMFGVEIKTSGAPVNEFGIVPVGGRGSAPVGGVFSSPTPQKNPAYVWMQSNKQLWNQKINCIKEIRTITSCGLKVAKDFVEAVINGGSETYCVKIITDDVGLPPYSPLAPF